MSRDVKLQGADFWDVNPCGGAWSSYREFMDWIQRTEPYIFRILDGYDWQGVRVLEVGCGQGATLNYLPAFGASVFGLDMSRASILRARSGAIELGHLERIRLLQSDAERLPFSASTFDAALSIGVLHHTVDTIGAIREIHRLLKPGGKAIVMLYRSGNPKWWMTGLLRGFARMVGRFTGDRDYLMKRLRANRAENQAGGTALLELFGVPVLKVFSNRAAMSMFDDYASVRIANYQPGFQRLADILPILRLFTPVLSWLDRAAQHVWGFYQVIEAQK